jgi:type II secretion system protein C
MEMNSVTDRGPGERAGGSAVKSPRLIASFAAALVLIALVAYVGHDFAARMFGASAPSPGPSVISGEVAARMPPAAAPRSRHGQSATAAGLELVGIVTSGRQGMAIIADAGGAQKIYRAGESIRPGVTLMEVLPGAVILDAGGASVRLSLTTGDALADALPGDHHAPAVSAAAITPQSKSTPDANSVTFGQRLNLDPKIGAHFALDEGGGFRLQKTKRDSPYANMGLRAGDVLRRLNGVSLESPKQLMALYRQLNDGGQGEVEVLRDGRFEVLRYGATK